MTSDPALQEILNSGWKFPQDLWNHLTEYDRSFAKIEFSGQRTPGYYQERLKRVGFTGMNRVLDAACGMGQWSIALAELNDQVDGVDISAERIDVAKKLVANYPGKFSFDVGALEKLRFPNESFDGIFCYGAFMFTDMPRTLNEFVRVLKPGGLIYINANNWGWYLHMIVHRCFKQGNLRLLQSVLKMMARTVLGKQAYVVVTLDFIKRLAAPTGLKIIGHAPEGCVDLDSGQPKSKDILPAYPATLYGLPAVFEVVLKKPNLYG